jgi:hypothetical protein
MMCFCPEKRELVAAAQSLTNLHSDMDLTALALAFFRFTELLPGHQLQKPSSIYRYKFAQTSRWYEHSKKQRLFCCF